MITARTYLDKQDPAVWRALNGLRASARESAHAAGIDDALIELINIRASQINGCAFCLNLHVEQALAAGETSQRIAVLPAWRDAAALFSPRERAALALAETVSTLPEAHTLERELAEARIQLTDAEFSAVSWIAIAINSLNRVSIISGHPVHPSPEATAVR